MIYIAAPLPCASSCRVIGEVLGAADLPVCSTWHDTVEPGEFDPTDEAERRRVLVLNLEDMQRARVVVANLSLVCDAIPAKATHGEIGYALGQGKRIVWLQPVSPRHRSIFDAHPLSTICARRNELVACVRAALEAS